MQELRQVDNGGGFRDGPIAFYQSNGYLYHMAPSDSGWNLYARNIDAASAHMGGDWHGLHAVNWYGAMAIASLDIPVFVTRKWWQKVESDYTDQYGLVHDHPRSEWEPGKPGDNDLLWTSWYYLARRLSPDGDWDDSLIDQFNNAVRKAQDVPGLFFRHPDKREYTAFDDYFGLATASYICDPQRSVARDIFQYGLTHGGGPFSNFVYGRAGNNIRTLWARPWLISFLGIATNERGRLSLADRTATDADFIGDVTQMVPGANLFGLFQANTENPAFAWMQLRIENDPNTPAGALGVGSLRTALHGYRRTFDGLFPAGMADALAHWGDGPDTWGSHPIHDGFQGVH